MIELGAKFQSYAEFQTALNGYEKTVHKKFWVRDCRTLLTHARKFPNSPAASAPDHLKYYFAVVSCVQGGKKYESKSKRQRTNTLRQGCQAGLHLKLSKCCEYLEIVKLNEEHNHVNGSGGKSKSRYTPGDIIEDLKVLVGDGHYNECIEHLERVYKCEVNALADEDDNVLGIFFQDPEMKAFYSAYPEAVFVETASCLFDGGPLIYVFLIEDPSGKGVVIAVAILLRDDMEILDWMINQFPECNQNCKDIEVVLCKENYKLAHSFEKVFPRISPHIPVHHFMQQIENDLTLGVLNLNAQEIKTAKTYMQELMFAVSQQNYKEVFKQMEANVKTRVMKYYKSNWKDIQQQWVMYRTINYRYFLNQTEWNVQNVWAKLKSVIGTFTNLRHFFKRLFAALSTIRTAGNSVSNLKFNNNETSKEEDAYKKLLTTYAFEVVQIQMITSKDCNNIQTIAQNNIIMSTSEGLLEVTETACPCLLRSSMMLPCRHIFKFRAMMNMPLYDENICSEYWFRSHYETLCDNVLTGRSIEPNSPKIDRTKTVDELCYTLSKLCSKVPVDLFEKRLRYVRYLVQRWSDPDDDDADDIDKGFAAVDVGTDECVLINREDQENEFVLSNDAGSEFVKVMYDAK